jgi:hypothetical protein
LTLISTHAPSEEKDEAAKVEFYNSLESVYDAVPNYKLKTVLGDLNTKVGKKSCFYPEHVQVTAFTTKQMIKENKW